MRVLQVLPTSGPGGAESVVTSLSQGLQEYGIEVVVASFGHQPHLYEKLEDIGVDAVRIEADGVRAGARRLGELFIRLKPDLVQSHMFDANLPAALAGIGEKLPTLLTVHSTVYEMESRKRRMVYALLGRTTAGTVAVSDSVALALRRAGVPANKLNRIYNGVDISRFNTGSKGSLRAELGILEDAPVAGMVANLRPAKDHALFIQASALVCERLPQAHFILAGDRVGPEASELVDLIAQLGLHDRVHLAGLRDDIPDVLSSLDIFVLASKIEGLPVSIIEAMASSLPVVATDVGGVHELVQDGVTGYLVPQGDRYALADRIVNLLGDNPSADGMRCRGLERASASFSIESMTLSHIKLYEKSLRKATGRISIQTG